MLRRQSESLTDARDEPGGELLSWLLDPRDHEHGLGAGANEPPRWSIRLAEFVFDLVMAQDFGKFRHFQLTILKHLRGLRKELDQSVLLHRCHPSGDALSPKRHPYAIQRDLRWTSCQLAVAVSPGCS